MKIKTDNETYTVTNNNSSTKQHGSTRVKDSAGHVLACVSIKGKSDPLGYIQRNMLASERMDFVRQLRASSVPDDDIVEILKPTPTAYQKKKLLRGDNDV